MIFYRLGLKKIIEYFQLDKLFKEDERRLVLLRRKPKEVYRTKMNVNPHMELCISALLSIISSLTCFSVPFATLDSPCEVLKSYNFTTLYHFAKQFERYKKMIDRLIISLFIILVYVTVKTIVDGINNTDLSKSPWLERGKYVEPVGRKAKKVVRNKEYGWHLFN